MIQIFGHHAVRAVLDVQEADIKEMAGGRHVFSDIKLDNGYVILSFKGSILGLGLFIDGRITSQMPRRDMVKFVELLTVS
jgi:NOL1/NOP2/fmu family ribosome biogenesis protein